MGTPTTTTNTFSFRNNGHIEFGIQVPFSPRLETTVGETQTDDLGNSVITGRYPLETQFKHFSVGAGVSNSFGSSKLGWSASAGLRFSPTTYTLNCDNVGGEDGDLSCPETEGWQTSFLGLGAYLDGAILIPIGKSPFYFGPFAGLSLQGPVAQKSNLQLVDGGIAVIPEGDSLAEEQRLHFNPSVLGANLGLRVGSKSGHIDLGFLYQNADGDSATGLRAKEGTDPWKIFAGLTLTSGIFERGDGGAGIRVWVDHLNTTLRDLGAPERQAAAIDQAKTDGLVDAGQMEKLKAFFTKRSGANELAQAPDFPNETAARETTEALEAYLKGLGEKAALIDLINQDLNRVDPKAEIAKILLDADPDMTGIQRGIIGATLADGNLTTDKTDLKPDAATSLPDLKKLHEAILDYLGRLAIAHLNTKLVTLGKPEREPTAVDAGKTKTPALTDGEIALLKDLFAKIPGDKQPATQATFAGKGEKAIVATTEALEKYLEGLKPATGGACTPDMTHANARVDELKGRPGFEGKSLVTILKEVFPSQATKIDTAFPSGALDSADHLNPTAYADPATLNAALALIEAALLAKLILEQPKPVCPPCEPAAPAAPPPPTTNTTTVYITDTEIVVPEIYFDQGKATIKGTSVSTLKAIIDALQSEKGKPITKLRIEGNASSEGKEALNQTLSEARARAIQTYLTGHGLSRTRPDLTIEIVGHGEEFRRYEKGKGSENKPVSRRAVFRILEKKDPSSGTPTAVKQPSDPARLKADYESKIETEFTSFDLTSRITLPQEKEAPAALKHWITRYLLDMRDETNEAIARKHFEALAKKVTLAMVKPGERGNPDNKDGARTQKVIDLMVSIWNTRTDVYQPQ